MCGRQTRHRVARHNPAQIPNTVDNSGRSAAGLPASKIHRDGSGKKGIRSNQKKGCEVHEHHRSFRPAKVANRQPHQCKTRSRKTTEHYYRTGPASKPVAEDPAKQYRDPAEERKERTLGSGVSGIQAQRLCEVRRCPEIERFANECKSEREDAGEPELAARNEWCEQWDHAGRSRLFSLGTIEVVGVDFRFRLADIDRRLFKEEIGYDPCCQQRLSADVEDFTPAKSAPDE